MEEWRIDIGRIFIVEANVVTAVGGTLEETWRSIARGTSGIAPVQRFSTADYDSRIAATVRGIESSGERSIILDIINRLLERMNSVPEDVSLITATTKLGIDNLERMSQGEKIYARDILPATMPELVAAKLGLRNTGVNISAACASSTIATAQAAEMIAGDRADAVLVCCADVVTKFTFSGFSSLKVVSSSACRPFDRNRDGLNLGDGAAALLLMSEQRARKENRDALGVVKGWGIAGDAFHITSPAPDGMGLIMAVRQALNRAKISRDEISVISAHGTGTIYNDLMELTAFNNLFGGRQLPVYSVKGSTGHTIGAAGGIEIALATKVLESRTALPTVGFEEAETGAEGRVSNEPTPFSGDYVLTCNSGFGGINAAIVLETANK